MGRSTLLPEKTISGVRVEVASRFTASQVREIRLSYGVSQGVFAIIMGCDTATVSAWEQSRRRPGPMARRLLDELASNPEYWHRKLKSIIKPR